MLIDPQNLDMTATLVFDEEFNSIEFWNGSSGRWEAAYPWSDISGGSSGTTGELQWYINPFYGPTSSVNPYTISNGVLTIEGKPATPEIQAITGHAYTSGMITTYHSFAQTYGYFEMRAQLPAGQGLWPAFWLLPTDQSWPPEIDIMEMLGSLPTTLQMFIHYDGNLVAGGVVDAPGMTTGFHTYGVDWEKDYITWYFDGTAVARQATPPDMNKPMYMLADLAIGGDWPGSPDGTTPFPAHMQIDYIRAYAARPDTPIIQALFDLPVTPPTTHLIQGNSRNNVLTATSPNTFFDSWGGNDTMTGLGNDVFLVYTSKCKIIENTYSLGIDTVLNASKSYTLPKNVENMTLIGVGKNPSAGSQTGIGNELDNLMISNSTFFGNIMKGLAGNDELIAGKGPDILTGGTGIDDFVFKALPNRAGHITDFTVGTDLLDLRGIFKTAGYTGTDPIADHHLILAANSSGGTGVYYDPSGNPLGPKTLITTLDHVQPSALHLQADIWFK
ncbi:MAG: glycoside hydrolase family 16 [Pseudomonadota bacterium]|jgi:beta-glucanase (GH16 family)